MDIPSKLVDYKAYNEANTLVGITTVTLPSIEYLSDTHKGPGILGEMDMPTIGMPGSMECQINWRTINDDFSKYIANNKGLTVEFRGANQVFDSGSHSYKIVPIKVAVAGVVKSAEFGDLEVSAEGGANVTLELYRYKVTINNVDYLEVDKLAKVFKQQGTDIYADVRAALGE